MASESFWYAARQFAAQPSTWVAVFVPLTLSVALVARAAWRGRFPPWLAVTWVVCVALSQALSAWVVSTELRSLHVASVFTVAVVMAAYLRVHVDLGLAFGLTHLALLLVDVVEAARYAAVNGESTAEFFIGVGGAGLLDGLLFFPVTTVVVLAYSRRRYRQAAGPAAAS